MDLFLQQARKGIVLLPHQRSFSVEKWRRAFEEISHPTIADRALYESGFLIHEQLVAIRNRLNTLRLDEIDRQTLIRMVCGNINLKASYLRRLSYEWLESRHDAGEPPMYHELLHGLHDENGYTGMNLNGMLELIIDGARFPLRIASMASDHPSSTPHIDSDVEKCIDEALLLGQTYLLYEEAMERCVWCDWHVEPDDGVMMIRPRFTEEQIRTDIARLRRQEMAEISIIRSKAQWTIERSREEREALVRRRGAIYVELEEGSFRCSLMPSDADIDNPSILLVSMLVALDAYPEFLVTSDFNELGGVPITRLLNAWLLLESIAHADAIKGPMAERYGQHLLPYAPLLLKDDLERCIAESQQLSPSQARSILQQLTYNGKREQELWNRPFVEIDEHTLIPVLPVLTAPAPFLSIQKWLRDAKINPDVKGKDFEEYVRSELTYAFISARIIRNGGVYPGRIRTIDTIGDIDLCFWFGNTIVVCEVKSTVVPDTPHAEHNYHQLVAGARNQAATKAAFVRDNLQTVLHHTGIQLDSTHDVQIQAIVLTSMTHIIGGQEGEIPCTDLLTLHRFIATGEAVSNVIFDITGKTYHHHSIPFYESEEEAERRFAEYFRHPPQFETWLNRAVEEYQPLPPTDTENEQWMLWYVRLAAQKIPENIVNRRNQQ